MEVRAPGPVALASQDCEDPRNSRKRELPRLRRKGARWRQGKVGYEGPRVSRRVKREKGTPTSGEWGDRYAVSPNQRGFDPGSLYDRNRWDPINLPLRGSRGSYCPSVHTIPLVRRGHGMR